MSGVFTDRLLDSLRGIGDADDIQTWIDGQNGNIRSYLGLPPADPKRPVDVDRPAFFAAYAATLTRTYGMARGWSGNPSLDYYLDGQLDQDKIERASALFFRYGTEIGAALLLAALPEAYAASFGSLVLYEVSPLTGAPGPFLTRRIAATAQFLVNVMTPPPGQVVPTTGELSVRPAVALWQGGAGSALLSTMELRMRHGLIRWLAKGKETDLAAGRPVDMQQDKVLNQEDLLGTLLTFSVTVFEVLEQFGIMWSADDQAAYLYAWDVVGHYLGVGDPLAVRALEASVGGKPPTPQETAFLESAKVQGSLRPQTVADARALLDRIRTRVWTAYRDPNQPARFDRDVKDRQPGRLLLRALVEDVQRAMPPNRQLWPIRVIRQLVPPTVSDRLALGARSGQDLLTSTLPSPKAVVGRFTTVDRRNPVGGVMLRRMASDVADRYFTKLIDQGLTIPGLQFSREGQPATS